jgi:hypothetical protein
MSKPLNQPTKKLNKGGVLRKRDTSSLARLDHSCVRNALLEMVNVPSNYNTGCSYANGIFVSVEGLDFLKLRPVSRSR